MQTKPALLIILLTALLSSARAQTANLNEDLLAAARKSDVAAVKALLAKGADVNAKSPYGATPLFFACDRGSVEVVKVLLDAGADVNIRDTFYKSTPMTWAIQHDHGEVVKLLVEKAPQSREPAIAQAIGQSRVKTATALLATGTFKPDALMLWLMLAEKNGAPEIAEALKKAGAKPKPKNDFKIEPEKLARYEGTFKNERFEVVIKVKDGKLVGTANRVNYTLEPMAEHTFELLGDASIAVFKLEGEKVTGVTLKEASGETILKKVEAQ